MKKQKKVKKRFVMGEGYPWYFMAGGVSRGLYDALTLYKKPLNEKSERIPLFWSDTGNWNRVRIVCEVLE